MFQSIFVYGIMIISLSLLLSVKVRIVDNKICAVYSRLYNVRYWVAILIIVFFSAVRWDVGIDQLSYLSEYKLLALNGTPFRQDMEIGFVWLMKLLIFLGAHFTVFFGVVALIQSTCTFSYFRDERYLLPYLSFLIITGNVFFMWSNTIRHTMVIAIFLSISALVLKNKKIWLYVFVAIALMLIHKSAILLLSLVPLFYLNLNSFYVPRKYQYLLFISPIVLSSFSLWQYLLDYVDILSLSVGYERYNSDVLLSVGDRDMAFGPRRIIFVIIDSLLIFYSRKMRKAFPTRIFGFAYILFMIYYIFMPLFMDSMAFSRIFDYFQIGRILISSYLLFYLFQYQRTNNNALSGLFIVFLFVFHLLIQIYADTGNHTDCIRYEFFWNA